MATSRASVTVWVDDRRGSKELVVPLLEEPGIHPELTRLDYGDVVWEGYGPAGPCLIACERKTISDLISSITSNRLSGHQLPGLLAPEVFECVWLVVEGDYWADRYGTLCYPGCDRGARQGRASLKLDAVEHYLTTLAMRAGVQVRHTRTLTQTVQAIAALVRWWTAKKWADHRAHLAPRRADIHGLWGDRRSLVARMANQLPGVGEEKAEFVGRAFATPREMVLAGPDAWGQIPGIGKTLSERLARACLTGKEGKGY